MQSNHLTSLWRVQLQTSLLRPFSSRCSCRQSYMQISLGSEKRGPVWGKQSLVFPDVAIKSFSAGAAYRHKYYHILWKDCLPVFVLSGTLLIRGEAWRYPPHRRCSSMKSGLYHHTCNIHRRAAPTSTLTSTLQTTMCFAIISLPHKEAYCDSKLPTSCTHSTPGYGTHPWRQCWRTPWLQSYLPEETSLQREDDKTNV